MVGMDSNNNSASLQSSSGGDEEYDSRAATSYSPFMANQQFPRPPSPYSSNAQITPSMFDPSSSGYNFVNQNPLLNLDMLTWSKSFRSADPQQQQPTVTPQTIQAHVPGVRPSSSPEQGTSTSSRGGSGSGVGPVRNSKKRSRASRRAPTTVLTTDTTNFRAMVQEFTGIPAPPFSTSSINSSLFPRTTNRLDLFSSTPPNYGLLRPFATKIQPPPTTTHVSTATSVVANNNNINNFQLPHHHHPPIVNNSDHLAQVNSNNPMLSFQSLLQTSSSSTTPNYSSLPQFNNALSGMEPAGTTSSSSMMMMRRRSSNISYGDPRQQQQEDLGAATNIDHGRDRGRGDQEENVASRSEGMVESWISSSD